ncbi:hypothetical protein CLV43_107149 [Umezawaea tangerina]|uniref:Uncharacterized protein n=1 Tax=Umezawaea tangerina TaxID=84725 RepID=A0A2T0T1N2_9PSEU|nr:hypothetical protein CLV43_107149 [Umezawaea tangerina]
MDRLFPLLTAVTLLAPAVAGGLLGWSWWGALTAFLWASKVRWPKPERFARLLKP